MSEPTVNAIIDFLQTYGVGAKVTFRIGGEGAGRRLEVCLKIEKDGVVIMSDKSILIRDIENGSNWVLERRIEHAAAEIDSILTERHMRS